MEVQGLVRNKRILFYLLAIIVAFAVWMVQRYMRATAPSSSGVVSSISLNGPESAETQGKSDPQGAAVQMYTTATSLLTTLATALLGALGYLLMNERQARLHFYLSVPAVLSATFAVVSIYFGYRCDSNALWYVFQGAFTPDAPPLVWPKMAQFFCLLLAVFFFADYAFNELGKGPHRERR